MTQEFGLSKLEGLRAFRGGPNFKLPIIKGQAFIWRRKTAPTAHLKDGERRAL